VRLHELSNIVGRDPRTPALLLIRALALDVSSQTLHALTLLSHDALHAVVVAQIARLAQPVVGFPGKASE